MFTAKKAQKYMEKFNKHESKKIIKKIEEKIENYSKKGLSSVYIFPADYLYKNKNGERDDDAFYSFIEKTFTKKGYIVKNSLAIIISWKL